MSNVGPSYLCVNPSCVTLKYFWANKDKRKRKCPRCGVVGTKEPA